MRVEPKTEISLSGHGTASSDMTQKSAPRYPREWRYLGSSYPNKEFIQSKRRQNGASHSSGYSLSFAPCRRQKCRELKSIRRLRCGREFARKKTEVTMLVAPVAV